MKIAFLLLCSLCAVAQNPSASDNDVEKQLLEIEQKIGHANSTCDYNYFRTIEAEEFLFTDSQGNIITRAEGLAGEKDCKPNSDQHSFEEARLIHDGNLAVLNARQTITGQRKGKDFRVQTRFTDVFVWRSGRWQLLAGHSSRIPKKD